jgi:hypothetical protein
MKIQEYFYNTKKTYCRIINVSEVKLTPENQGREIISLHPD